MKIFDVETIERFDTATRNIDDDRFVRSTGGAKSDTNFRICLGERDLRFFRCSDRASKRETKAGRNVWGTAGDDFIWGEVAGDRGCICCVDPRLYSIWPKSAGEKMLIGKESSNAFVDCLYLSLYRVLKLRVDCGWFKQDGVGIEVLAKSGTEF